LANFEKRKQVGNIFAVRLVQFESGERFPMLVERASGIPLFEPAIYALTEVRAGNKASRTIDQVVRAILVFMLFLDAYDIDINARLETGRILDLNEVDALVRYCRSPLADLSAADTQSSNAKDATPFSSKPNLLEKIRMRAKSSSQEISQNTLAIRLVYIKKYVDWLIRLRLSLHDARSDIFKKLQLSSSSLVSALAVRSPSARGRNVYGKREGLSEDMLERLICVIDPVSKENPWKSVHARERNSLIVHWLIHLGLRRGELLGVRISDINFQTNEVFIARRPDDPEDPRTDQPLSKTRDRLLPISDDLAERTRRYILGQRRKFRGARRHDFLIVANGNGAPLTLSAMNKLFISLRRGCPDLPDELTPHVLRHTWNDLFSKMIDATPVGLSKPSEEKEQQMRSYLAGWSPTSGTAATYTRRHIRTKGKKASLVLQENLIKGAKNVR